jgi:hypothetical protein
MVIPQGALPSGAGAGPITPRAVLITTPGSTDISTLGVPSGSAVLVELLSGGGGGAAANSSADPGGGGGGAGSYAMVRVPADVWALGGTVVVGAGGAGGTPAGTDGGQGSDSVLTIDSVARVTCQGGRRGTHLGAGGVGGTVTVDASVTRVATKLGTAGITTATTAGGAGGQSPAPAGGGGGAGGSGTSGAGGAGGNRGGGGGGGSRPAGVGGAGAGGYAKITF